MGATSLQSVRIAFRCCALTERRLEKRVSLVLSIVAIVLVNWSAMARTEPKANLILPGTSVSGVELGSTPSTFQAAYSQRPGRADSTQSGTYGEGCPENIYYWSDLTRDTSVVTAYLKEGRISQFSVLSSGADVLTTERPQDRGNRSTRQASLPARTEVRSPRERQPSKWWTQFALLGR
jgi:hypothetical protein